MDSKFVFCHNFFHRPNIFIYEKDYFPLFVELIKSKKVNVCSFLLFTECNKSIVSLKTRFLVTYIICMYNECLLINVQLCYGCDDDDGLACTIVAGL